MDTCTRNVLSICSGYGGIELGLGVVERTRTVCYVENEISVASILAARMEDGSLDSAPVWSNLRTFDPEPWRGKVDIIAGGFPCQPFSVAGAKRGADDNRNLWPEVERIARGLGYPTLFLENVTGVLDYHYKTIRPSLQEMGYTVKEGLFTAAETGAPHKRQRLFILAYTDYERLQGKPRNYSDEEQSVCEDIEYQSDRVWSNTGWGSSELAYTDNSGDPSPRYGVDRDWQEKAKEREDEPLTEPSRPNSDLAYTESERHGRGDSPQCGDEQRFIQSEEPGGSEMGSEAEGCDSKLADTRHTELKGRVKGEEGCQGSTFSESASQDSELADSNGEGLERDGRPRQEEQPETTRTIPFYPPGPNEYERWSQLLTIMPQVEPAFCRDADGTPSWVDRRLRATGNGVVPSMAAYAWLYLGRDDKEVSMNAMTT